MQISSRFTIAVHVLICIVTFQGEYKTTSDFLASSVNVNPVVIRRILQQLKAAELITVARGSGGAMLSREPDEITLLDIYNAVECVEGELFHFHENPNQHCPIGRNIHQVLNGRLERIQEAMEQEMRHTRLIDMVTDMTQLLMKEQ